MCIDVPFVLFVMLIYAEPLRSCYETWYKQFAIQLVTTSRLDWSRCAACALARG